MPISPDNGGNVYPSNRDPELTKVFASNEGGKAGPGAMARDFGADVG